MVKGTDITDRKVLVYAFSAAFVVLLANEDERGATRCRLFRPLITASRCCFAPLSSDESMPSTSHEFDCAWRWVEKERVIASARDERTKIVPNFFFIQHLNSGALYPQIWANKLEAIDLTKRYTNVEC